VLQSEGSGVAALRLQMRSAVGLRTLITVRRVAGGCNEGTGQTSRRMSFCATAECMTVTEERYSALI
jgi:hypothetical protein